jgi:hypothetical protein
MIEGSCLTAGLIHPDRKSNTLADIGRAIEVGAKIGGEMITRMIIKRIVRRKMPMISQIVI